MTNTTVSGGDAAPVGLVLNSGDTLREINGGSAVDTQDKAGEVDVASGGSDLGTVIGAKGSETVAHGGYASGTNVQGYQKVAGSSVDANVNGDGYQLVTSGGTATSATVTGAALQRVRNGGVSSDTAVSSGGTVLVGKGGSATDATAGNDGLVKVRNGGVLTSATATSGGAVVVGKGGTAHATTVGPDAQDTVLAGGSATNTHVDGGEEQVRKGGTASGTMLDNGGFQSVSGTAYGTTVSSGSNQTVASGGVASGTVLDANGYETVQSGGQANGVTVGSQGVLQVDPGATVGSVTVTSGATLMLQGEGVHLGMVTGYNSAVTIALPDESKDQISSVQMDSSTHQLVVTFTDGNTDTVQLDPATNYAGQNVTVQTDDGTACYLAGTRILTEHGYRPIETLAAGDRVRTVAGGLEPICWIGTRSYAGRMLARRPETLPVRIRKGALGEQMPVADLLLSPLHALLIDGVLVPAGVLVNGTTILREQGLEVVAYYHLELREHMAIWAEGVAAETYVEDGDRGMFHNAPSAAAAAAPAAYCAPRVTEGYQLETIRARLEGRQAA